MPESPKFNPYRSDEGSLEPLADERAVEVVPADGRNLSMHEILFDPVGRLSRWTYFKYSVASGMAWWFAILAAMSAWRTAGSILAILLFVVAAYSQIVMMVKRWHDMGEPGASVVLNFIPILNFRATIKVYLTKGTPGGNAYGLEEKAGRLVPDPSAGA